MIKGHEIQDVTKEFILSRVDYWDIFCFYIPNLKINKTFLIPWRETSKSRPSGVIKIGTLTKVPYFWDLAQDETLNAFQYVGKVFGLNYNESLYKIATDMGIISNILGRDYKQIIAKYEKPEVENNSSKRFDVWVRKFNKEELDYWKKRFLGLEELKKGEVYAYSKLAIDGTHIPRTDLISFAYYYPILNQWKIYTPESKEYKWLTNVPLSHIEGLNKLEKGKIGTGAKSRKDSLILSLFTPTVVELQNESIASATPDNIQFIKEHSSDFYISFDSDAPGVKNSLKYTQNTGFKYINPPKELLKEGIKDWSDWIYKHQSLEGVKEYLTKKGII